MSVTLVLYLLNGQFLYIPFSFFLFLIAANAKALRWAAYEGQIYNTFQVLLENSSLEITLPPA
ncbi:MAG: hypothetical protein IPN25_00055 [Sphingobacteriales bacterium]|nr:hypothetical protein [Sphingobacteriales bacterium]